MHNLDMYGVYCLQVVRHGETVLDIEFKNGIVDQGRNHLLDTFFGAEDKDTWYLGLIGEITSFTNEDTLASHAGWTEVDDYTGDRKEAVFPDAAASRIIRTNLVTFTMSDSATLEGAFLCNAETGDTGILWSTGRFEPFDVVSTDEVNVRYELRVRQ